jgi:hypothetical protein
VNSLVVLSWVPGFPGASPVAYLYAGVQVRLGVWAGALGERFIGRDSTDHHQGESGMPFFPLPSPLRLPPVRKAVGRLAGKCNALAIFRERLFHLRQPWGGLRYA